MKASTAILRAQYPYLVSADGNALVAAAKNIRTELKRAFPGVKFSVTSSRFSGGDAIRINWTDGPTSDQVDEIADRYEAGTFNGQDDSYTYSMSDWAYAFGDAKYISTSRNYSDKAVSDIIKRVAVLGLGMTEDVPTAADYNAGRVFARYFGTENLNDAISRALWKQTWAISKYKIPRPFDAMADEAKETA